MIDDDQEDDERNLGAALSERDRRRLRRFAAGNPKAGETDPLAGVITRVFDAQDAARGRSGGALLFADLELAQQLADLLSDDLHDAVLVPVWRSNAHSLFGHDLVLVEPLADRYRQLAELSDTVHESIARAVVHAAEQLLARAAR
ncbi:hypothetical protein LRS13_15890 [Svornostia abyssi]|uniref:Uncharacterized protein n=1 Tax=Svornostia abyssi TaxID=2898438 RepID=A0ABY5PC02_9ACTN|nr:hypothetical protein LRS13_15890 [Parviterribacteraceae bacterium J379]